MTQANDRRDAPPRLAEWLLEVAIGQRVARHGLIGDLRERFGERRRRNRWLVCAVWFWRQALSASGRYTLERVLHVRRAPHQMRQPHDVAPPRNRKDTSFMAHFVQDVRYALRMLRKAPGMAAISILALTLGTGVPTIMFTIVNGVLRDLPVDQPHRVLQLFRTTQRGLAAVTHHDLADWRAQQTSFEGIAGFTREDVTLSGGDARPLRRNAAFVTANTFDVLGVQPILGRSFRADDEQPASTPVVMIGYAAWQARFAGDPGALGQVISIDGGRYTVIGVMQERFGFPYSEDLWLPYPLELDGPREDSPRVQVFGRLRSGVSIEQARAELGTIAARLADAYPEINGELGADVAPYAARQIPSEIVRGLYTMLGAVSFVLLIACANVANLLLARAVNRSQEIAVRTALGARRLRVASQFLVEALVITTIGGVLGLVVAWIGVSTFDRALTSLIGIAWVDIRIDVKVMLFVMGLMLVASIMAGMLPALQASGTNVNDSLKDDSRGVSSLRLGRFGKGLVIGEIALSCALLVVSGLMIKGVLEIKGIDLGMPVAEIVTGEVEVPRQVYTTPEARARFFDELENRIEAIPGVAAVAMMSDIPGTVGFALPVVVEGQEAEGGRSPRVGGLTVTPDFLDVLDAPVLTGRGFTAQDRVGSEPVILINESFARRFFPEREPVGRTVQWGRGQAARTIVGVVPDLFMGSLDRPDFNGPGIYLPLAQSGNVSMQVMVRAARDPMSTISQIRDALEALDPTLAIMNVDRVDRLIAQSTAVFDIFGKLFLFFGLTALFLASIGLYGVMSFTVAQRTREWGVRMALGAKGSDVMRLVMKQAVVQLLVGLSAGLVIAGALSVPLANFFYQVEPWDRTIFVIIAVILSATGVLAASVPARRATRVDPLEALRYE